MHKPCIFEAFSKRLKTTRFVLRNCIFSLFLDSFPSIQSDDQRLTYRGMQSRELQQVTGLLITLNGGEGLSLVKKLLYRCFGNKLILLAIANEGTADRVVGMDMFYFNRRDISVRTIHEGFIGVTPDRQGRGIATSMRSIALDHFRRSWVKGVSTRISSDNLASIKSAEKLGFRPMEKYFDGKSRANRFYMVCNFS